MIWISFWKWCYPFNAGGHFDGISLVHLQWYWVNKFSIFYLKNEHVLWQYFPRPYSSVKWMDAILLNSFQVCNFTSRYFTCSFRIEYRSVRSSLYWWTTQMMFDVYASVKMIAQIENRFQSSKWTFVLFIINAMCAGWLTEPFNAAVAMRQWIFSLFNRNPTFSCQNRKIEIARNKIMFQWLIFHGYISYVQYTRGKNIKANF